MALWSSEEHHMPSTIPSTIWYGSDWTSSAYAQPLARAGVDPHTVGKVASGIIQL
jgi:hypothetical protein